MINCFSCREFVSSDDFLISMKPQTFSCETPKNTQTYVFVVDNRACCRASSVLHFNLVFGHNIPLCVYLYRFFRRLTQIFFLLFSQVTTAQSKDAVLFLIRHIPFYFNSFIYGAADWVWVDVTVSFCLPLPHPGLNLYRFYRYVLYLDFIFLKCFKD